MGAHEQEPVAGLPPLPAGSEPRLAVSTVIFALRPDPVTAAPALWLPLVRRVREPQLGRWALPGGPIGADEGLAEAAARDLRATTGLGPSYLEQLYCFGDPARSPQPGPRMVSVVYWALVRPVEAAALVDDPQVRWFPADALPELAFDHNLVVDYALWRLRNKMGYASIAHALLGATFTLAELREVYEVVLQRRIDPANFRRQVEGELIATGEQVTGNRHRPARLYRYDSAARRADHGPLDGTPEGALLGGGAETGPIDIAATSARSAS